jgi:hypothetical protein
MRHGTIRPFKATVPRDSQYYPTPNMLSSLLHMKSSNDKCEEFTYREFIPTRSM